LNDASGAFQNLGDGEFKFQNNLSIKIENGVLVKELKKKRPVSVITSEFSEVIDNSYLTIDIKNLESQFNVV